MTRIFIENHELDLTAEITQQLTFSVDDIRNLDSKTTAFSKTILIPGTQRNNKIFGNIYELSNANLGPGNTNVFYDYDASKQAVARIEVNGLQAMKGVMRLLSISVDKGAIEYEVALFGELGGFITRLGNKRLEDLDFRQYNHVYDYDHISQTWNNNKSPIAINPGGLLSYFTAASSTSPALLYIFGQEGYFPPNSLIIISGGANSGIYTVASYSVAVDPLLGPSTTVYIKEDWSSAGAAGITITQNIKNGYGYCYPLIDYGVSDPDGTLGQYPANWNYKTFKPALFVLEYIDKIITGAGYTWDSDFLKSNFFRSLIIPNNEAQLGIKDNIYYVQSANNSYQETLTSAYNGDYNWDSTPSILFNFSSPLGFDTAWRYDGGSIAPSIKVSLQINALITLNGNSSLKFFITKNGYKINISDEVNSLGTGYNGAYSLTLEALTYVGVGDIISWGFTWISNGKTGNIDFNGVNNYVNIVNDPPVILNYLYGSTLKMNDLLPKNVFQRDFFTSIMKMFNLMVVEDRDKTRHLKIVPYITFGNVDRASYLDWSYNVNRDKPIQIKPMSEINARYYDFKYKDDSDYFNDLYKKRYSQTYGNRTYDNNLEFAKDNSTIEIIFSPSVLVGIDGEDKVWPAIYKDNAGVREVMSHNIRIMQIKTIFNVNSWDVFSETSGTVTSLGSSELYLYAGHFDNPDYPTIDINWGATKELYFALAAGSLQYNMFNLFYSPYMAEIIDKDSRLVTCEMKLTEQDIFSLDFSRFVMIDGVLFRLVKIYDWSEGNLCKVDLLRVINTTYSATAIRCTINSNLSDPYETTPYFALSKFYDNGDFPFFIIITEFTINGQVIASGDILTLNDAGDLTISEGFDGRYYFAMITDWLNNIIPGAYGLRFYEDMNTVEYLEGTTFELKIGISNSGPGGMDDGFKYNNTGFYILVSESPDVYDLLGTYDNCKKVISA